MKIGDRVLVKAYKSDGTCYRWWYATVEAVEAGLIILVTPVGHCVEDIDGGWASDYAIRSYYWPDRLYSLMEAYAADGRLEEIYVNINSPVDIGDAEIGFIDYELDVSRRPPLDAHIADEEEFLEAASRYRYSDELRQACHQAAREAMEVANHWVAKGMPAI